MKGTIQNTMIVTITGATTKEVCQICHPAVKGRTMYKMRVISGYTPNSVSTAMRQRDGTRLGELGSLAFM
jgi:hypothetical protein